MCAVLAHEVHDLVRDGFGCRLLAHQGDAGGVIYQKEGIYPSLAEFLQAFQSKITVGDNELKHLSNLKENSRALFQMFEKQSKGQ